MFSLKVEDELIYIVSDNFFQTVIYLLEYLPVLYNWNKQCL